MSADYDLTEARALRAFLDTCACVAYAAVMAHRGVAHGPEWISLRWPQADKAEREAMLKAVTHWTIQFISVPEDPQYTPQPACFTVQEHRLIKSVVEGLRVHVDSGIKRPCLCEAGLSVTTLFQCARELDHVGPHLPAFVTVDEEDTDE